MSNTEQADTAIDNGLEHRQVPITEDGKEIFKVDEKLQSLIQFLNDQELYTYNSCQDNVEDTVWIQYDLGSWIHITTIAYDNKAYELLEFIQEICLIELTFQDDGRPDKNDEYWLPGENLIWGTSVRFPKELLPEFEQLIRDLFGENSPKK